MHCYLKKKHYFCNVKERETDMKYNELERLLRKAGCYPLKGKQINGHPAWYSPKTGKKFATSNHGSLDVKPGTLKQIMKDAGLD